MSRSLKFLSLLLLAGALLQACGNKKTKEITNMDPADSTITAKIKEFADVKLNPDISGLSENEKKMIPLLIRVADIMDELFWEQTYGNKDSLLNSITNPALRQFALINYGPWERLNGNKPFVPSFGEKPAGANFYPTNMGKEEFEAFDNKDKTSLYTLIRRVPDGALTAIWYSQAYTTKLQEASALMLQAAAFADDPGLKNYLELRAKALLTNDYLASDMAWMDMKDNTIDFVVGPIENYEDELFGYKAAFEALLLVKDKTWSQKLEKFSALLPQLQRQLPVDEKYKKERPGSHSDLNAYDILYYAGQANEGAKTIAINLPNDEQVQLEKGSRRLQLKNAMKAKFDNILLPIANRLVDPGQLAHVTFDAFFNNVMFHEVAHGLGIKNTITGKGPVRKALKETYSAFEEAKADILGLFLVTKLIEMGHITDIKAEDCYVTFLAGIFRSVRFGVASSHGKANMMCFNYFEDQHAFSRNNQGTYQIDLEKMKTAMNNWAAKVLVIEGEGDYQAALDYLKANSLIRPGLQNDLDGLKTASIPVDVNFIQGLQVLGLEKAR